MNLVTSTLLKFKLSVDELIVILLSILAIGLNILLPESLSGFRSYWNDSSWTLISLMTTFKCYFSARSFRGNEKRAWNIVALGCLFWFMGMLVWNYYHFIVQIQTPFPSYSDLGYLLLAPSIIVALVYFASESLTINTILYQLTRISVIFFALLLIHFLIFGSVIKSESVSNIYLITALSYPLLFFTILIHSVTSPWYRYSSQKQNIIRFILTGMFIHALANAEFAYIVLELGYYSSYYLDIAWTIGFVPIYFAASYAVKTKDITTEETRYFFVWLSENLNKIFLPLLLISLAVTIFIYRDLITSEMSDGFMTLIIIFTILLVSYMWLAEEKERSFTTQLYAKDLILKSFVDAVPYGIEENDLDGNVLYCNEAYLDIFSIKSKNLSGRKIWDGACTEEQKQQLQQRLQHVINTRPVPESNIDWQVSEDGQPIRLKTDWNYRYDTLGNLTGIVSVITNVTSHYANEEKIKQAATVFSSTTDGVIIADKNFNISAVNSAFSIISGYEESEVIGKNPRMFHSGKHTKEFYQSMWNNINENGFWKGEIWDQRKDGVIYPAWMSISVVKDDADQVTNYVAVFSDISRIKASEENLIFLAHHDPLTGLSNRTELDRKIDQAIKHSGRNETGFALFFIDLDQFKHINDSLGHTVGDNILIETAERLSALARDEDVVSRLGGDEFVILTESVVGVHDSISVAERIIEQFTQAFVVNELQLHVTPSIGISFFPENGKDSETLLKNADAAMYRAKLNGRNSFAYYSEDLTIRATERIKYENYLRQALEYNEFSLHFQPQVDTKTNRVHGIEALLRWQHPTEGMIPPTTFIPIAEECGLIYQIGAWVLEQSCSFMKELLAEGIELGHISVNVSGYQFVRGKFVELVTETLKETGLAANYLELEITESIIMEKNSKSVDALFELDEMGISISIDDFGTGYSSLSYLKKLPVNNIKIDRSFIRDIAVDKDDEAIVKAIIALGQALNLDIIAEGVEDTKQLAFLQQEGCHLIQGYLFSRPIPGDDLIKLLKNPAEIFRHKII